MVGLVVGAGLVVGFTVGLGIVVGGTVVGGAVVVVVGGTEVASHSLYLAAS